MIEAGDDALPEDLIVFLRLLLLSSSEWRKAREKESLPNPKPDDESLKLARRVLEERMKEYPTTIEVRPFPLHDVPPPPNVRPTEGRRDSAAARLATKLEECSNR